MEVLADKYVERAGDLSAVLFSQLKVLSKNIGCPNPVEIKENSANHTLQDSKKAR